MKEKYMSYQEELDRAESMMTSSQKNDSEIREKNWEQEQAPWIQFDDGNIDENFERKPATSEQKENMDKRLSELADAFDGSNLNWHLDGALNISLMNGEYIGNHKDVDLSIEKNELAAFEAQLLKKGFGLFLSRIEGETKNRVMRRVSCVDFVDSDIEHPLIAAIDKDGQIIRDKSLNFVDAHIIKRNAEGQALGESGVAIPDKWTKPYPVEFQGKSINLSHPGKVLYYKLHQGRGYDATDIQRLVETGKVTEEDVIDIEKVFESEFTANIEQGRKIFENVSKKLTTGMNADQIFDIILQQDELAKRANRAREVFKLLARKIYESEDKTPEAILRIGMELFKVEENNDLKREEIKKVKQSVLDAQKIKQVREEF